MDPLTGLPAQEGFRAAIASALASCQTSRVGMATVLMDVDHFGPLERRIGPAAGDELLGAVAGRLSATLRHGDILCRPSRGRFGIVLHGIGCAEDAARVAERALAALRRPFAVDGGRMVIRASAGLATGGYGTSGPDDLLGAARLSLERAKVEGGDRWAAFEPSLHATVTARGALENELADALGSGQLALEFQPERRVAGALGQAGSIRSVEALVRWRHPARGLVRPADFLPVAEESELIERIGAWVLREAVSHAKTWQSSDSSLAGLSVGVNLSTRELRRPGLVAEIAGVLADAGLAPEALAVEFREQAIADDPEVAIAALRGLRDVGVRTCIDDCLGGRGIGERLRRLPLDVVKIDPSLVAALGIGAGDDTIRSLVQTARSLGLSTVAEGVETPEQLTRLRNLGCDVAQGHVFGKPLGSEGISALLRAERRRRSDRSTHPHG